MSQKEKEILNLLDKNSNLTQIEKDVTVGTILGDGHIRSNIDLLKASLSYTYSKLDYASYVLNKLQNLSNYNEVKKYENLDTRYNKIRTSFGFNTLSFSSLALFAKLFLNKIDINGKVSFVKILPSYEVLLELITPQALAFWIMDDGHKYLRGGITLCTDSFTLEEVDRLMLVLINKFKFICTKHKKISNDKTKYYYRIYISSESMPLLNSLVKEFVHTSMLYKIEISPKKALSLKPKNVKARLKSVELKNWKEKYGNELEMPKTTRSLSDSPRAIKARLKRLEAKK